MNRPKIDSIKTPPQFGPALDRYNDRHSSYVVILENSRGLLVLEVGGIWHLPGGGLEHDEDPEAAAIREALEEGGLSLSNLEYIGRANQFFRATDVGDINKLGHFFSGELAGADAAEGDPEYQAIWVSPEEFLASNANDFQKWAVKRALERT